MKNPFKINKSFVDELDKSIALAMQEVWVTYRENPLGIFLLDDVKTFNSNEKISLELIEKIIEICFSASLEKEEGNFNNFSVILKQPETNDLQIEFKFKKTIEFNSTNIKKLAPAINPNNYQIGVWFDENNNLVIWGFKAKLLPAFISFNSISPGKLLINCLSGTRNSFKCSITFSETGFMSLFSPKVNPIVDWLGQETDFIFLQKKVDLMRIISQMFNSGCGGTILLVRENHQKWKSSMKEISYENGYLHKYTYGNIALKYEAAKEFQQMAEENKKLAPDERESVKNKIISANLMAQISLNDISNLTKIDGATVLSENLDVLTFGAKIGAKKELKKVGITEPFKKNSDVKRINKSDWKVGTRHTSAAEFVNEQRDCLAVVVSEDRKVSVISWDETYKLVKVTKNFEWMIFD